jgi:hypothetical protein
LALDGFDNMPFGASAVNDLHVAFGILNAYHAACQQCSIAHQTASSYGGGQEVGYQTI